MNTIYHEIKYHLENMNNQYKEREDTNQRQKEFYVGDEVMVYLQKETFLVGAYNKIKMIKFGHCKIIYKFDFGNGYEVELTQGVKI